MNKATMAAVGTILILTGGVMILSLPLLTLIEPSTVNWIQLFKSIAVYAVMIYIGVILVRKSKYRGVQ